MASIYKRGGIWWVKYYAGAKPVYKSLKTKRKAEALRLKQVIESKLIERPADLQERDTAVDSFWTQYLEWAQAHKRPRTIETEKVHWKHLQEFCARATLGAYRPSDFQAFKLWRHSLGNGPVTVNNALKHLQAIFNYARKLGFYNGENPVKHVERFKVEKRPPKYLTQEQIENLLATAEAYNENAYLGILLGVYAGMRRKEISFARWEWVDFGNKLVTVAGSKYFQVKDWEARTLPLHDRLGEILKARRQASGYILAPEVEPGRYRYRYDFRKVFDRVCKMSGLEWVTPHILRHTFASQLAMAGVSLYKIAKWLGHSDVKTTQVYAHLQSHDEDINRF